MQQPNTTQREYRAELQVAISTLVAGLGFYKAQELADFIHSIKDINLLQGNVNYLILIFPFFGFILYFGYLISVAFSLYFIYKESMHQQHQKAILFAVSCYFALQILMILIIWNTKKDDTQSNRMLNTFIIRTDSLEISVPYDTIKILER
jgi:hypothetical protein